MPSTHRPDERLLETAYELFCARGVRDVGVDELVERAGVANDAMPCRQFSSQDELIPAFLQLREERWIVGWLEERVRERGTPEERLLAVFDLFDEWFREPEYAGCPFVRVLLEMGPGHPAGAACIEHLEVVRTFMTRLAADAGFRDPAELAQSLHLLLYGSVIEASAGSTTAARRARRMAQAVLEDFRRPAA